MSKNFKNIQNNYEFIETAELNQRTYDFFCIQLRKIALSMFEWVNLPSSMNARHLEKTLFLNGKASIFNHKEKGIINTKAVASGNLNIYNEPTDVRCIAHELEETRTVYSGLIEELSEQKDKECILVLNDFDGNPTFDYLDLFAFRLYQVTRSIDININAQKTPILLLVDDNQLLSIKQLYQKYDGNIPVIFGDKNQLSPEAIRSINTQALFVADKLYDIKKQIFNEALTYLGVNNIINEKKERLVENEANVNNELINYNLQSYLAPRQEACRQFNELFGFTETEKEISVKVRSDLQNIIKQVESTIFDNDLNKLIDKEGEGDGDLHSTVKNNL